MSVMGKRLVVVIPAYRAEATIADVLTRMPTVVDHVVVVDDASPDALSEKVQGVADPRVVLIRHERNRGVGGAMKTGFLKALELGGELVGKIDADGQMAPEHVGVLARAAVVHGCDYVKGNRFGHLEHHQTMPWVRRVGNVVLSFLTKLASGYWNVYDPQNGYLLVTSRMLRRLDLEALDEGFFFENSMLINLNILRARIAEVYLPVSYGGEVSNLSIGRVLLSFPWKLTRGFLHRFYQKYVFRSVSPFALLFVSGVLFGIWGVGWGAFAWRRSILTGRPATTGTVVLSLLPLLLGWTSLLHALMFDVQDAGESVLLEADDPQLAGDD